MPEEAREAPNPGWDGEDSLADSCSQGSGMEWPRMSQQGFLGFTCYLEELREGGEYDDGHPRSSPSVGVVEVH